MTGTPQELPDLPGRDPAGQMRLTLLGNFALHAEGVPVAIPTKKNRALLAILALSPNGQATRERLCGLLWGDRGEEQARSSLRQALAVLRRELGPGNGILRTRDDLVALHLPDLDIDVLQFDRWSRGEGEQRRGAAALLRGELLADTSLHEAGFSEWLASERRRLSEQAIATLERLATEERGPGQIGYARRLVDLDPLREASHRSLMKALAGAGETGLALQQFEACKTILSEEFDVEPAAETLALRAAIAKAERASPASRAVETRDSPVPRDRPSLAVLPLANLSSDIEQQYMVDGLTEDLIAALSKVPGFFVIAAQTSLRYRDAGETAVGALGAKFVIRGSLRRTAAGYRIGAQLSEVTSGRVVWADHFDSAFDTINILPGGIAAKVADMLGAAAPEQHRQTRPIVPEAFDLCMRGRAAWRLSDDDGIRARRLFERAAEIDPEYSEPYRFMAESDYISWLFHNAPADPYRNRALASARKAVSCDRQDAAGRSLLAFILLYERQWAAAEENFQEALRLNPNDSETWSRLSDMRALEGKASEALNCARRSLELNPQPAAYYYWLLGQAQFAAGDYEGAVETLRRDETYRTGSRRVLAAALARLGRLDEARDEARLFMAAYPHFTISHWVETQPFRDLAMRDYFIDAYRKAGLPD